jgi:hypothetical protein
MFESFNKYTEIIKKSNINVDESAVTEAKSITDRDIKVDKSFKIGSSTFKVIKIYKDPKFGDIVNTERYTNNKKAGEYRDTLKDFVDFLNEEDAVEESVVTEGKSVIVVYDNKRLEVDPADIKRLKAGKDVVGMSTIHPGQEEWIQPGMLPWKIEESVIIEKSFNKIQAEWANVNNQWTKVTSMMMDIAASYKEAEGKEKEDLLDELKVLTKSKKTLSDKKEALEQELDNSISNKNKDLELVINEASVSPFVKQAGKVKIAWYELMAKVNPPEEKVLNVIAKVYSLAMEGANFHREMHTAKAIGSQSVSGIKANLQELSSDISRAAEWGGIYIAQGTLMYLRSIKQDAVADRFEKKINKEDDLHESIIVLEEFSNEELNERRIVIKRRYTENHPAVTVGKTANIRNRMLEAIADGKLTKEEFNTILKEMSVDSKRWTTRNVKYFNLSEDGVSLSKYGRSVLKQTAVNEKFINETFASFINEAGHEDDKGIVTGNDFNKIKGGKADNLTVDDIAKKHKVSSEIIELAIKQGMKVEAEHTEDATVTYEIAKDHVFEDPKYYDKLEKIEGDK